MEKMKNDQKWIQISFFILLLVCSTVKKEKPLPNCHCTTNIAQQFSLFFASKIEKLRTDIPTQIHVHNPTRSTTVISMHHFERVSGDLFSRILRKSPSKSCSFNAIPTYPLKDSWDITLPYITELFNISLADQFKKAIIRPFLKKPHLDPEDYSNYRPVANLLFLSKTLERIVANQLNNYFLQNDLFPSFQSAYRSIP